MSLVHFFALRASVRDKKSIGTRRRRRDKKWKLRRKWSSLCHLLNLSFRFHSIRGKWITVSLGLICPFASAIEKKHTVLVTFNRCHTVVAYDWWRDLFGDGRALSNPKRVIDRWHFLFCYCGVPFTFLGFLAGKKRAFFCVCTPADLLFERMRKHRAHCGWIRGEDERDGSVSQSTNLPRILKNKTKTVTVTIKEKLSPWPIHTKKHISLSSIYESIR